MPGIPLQPADESAGPGLVPAATCIPLLGPAAAPGALRTARPSALARQWPPVAGVGGTALPRGSYAALGIVREAAASISAARSRIAGQAGPHSSGAEQYTTEQEA